jgi:DNA phosphorothioation-dependent restriction protein DptG
MNDENNQHLDDRINDYESERRLAIEEIKTWIERLDEKEANKPQMIMGHRIFSPLQILREIEASTEYGKSFVRSLTRQRVEEASREDELLE